jgi:hypothetical protein
MLAAKGQDMPCIIVERTFDRPPSDDDLTAAGIRERPCLKLYGVAWRRSVISADRLRMVCQYEAADAESVRKVQREAGNAFDRVWAGEMIE